MSAVAQIAKAYGYDVSGCDQKQEGHSIDHLNNIDILAVTPAIYYQNASHPEFIEAKKRNIVMTWQEFMGNYLHKNKFLVCVAGTHGKSTTTALAGLLLDQAGLDPTVEVGATLKEWHNNMRIGMSKYFVCEADEYHDNFASYHPDILILNNVEMDHPEYFKTETNLLAHFTRLIRRVRANGHIIYNSDSPLIHKLNLPTNAISYSLSDFPSKLKLGVPGDHNKSNAMGIIKLAEILNIPYDLVAQSLNRFSGLSRRIELIGEKNGVKIYDDYANHPTAFAASIAGVKELNPVSKILAIIEPHTYSRLRAVLSDVPESLKNADQVIITKIFASRETDPGDFSGQDIANSIPNSLYIPEFSDVLSYVKNHQSLYELILVMGSGDSSKLAHQILDSL